MYIDHVRRKVRVMDRWTLRVRRITHWSYIPFLLITLSVLTLILFAASVLWSLPGYGLMQHDGLIWPRSADPAVRIEPHDPAATAGIMVGDRLLAVDGIPLAERPGLPYYGKAVGESVEIMLLRVDRPIVARLELGTVPLDVRLIRLELVLIAFLFWGISLVTWGLRPFHGVTRIFFLLSQVMATMLTTGSLSAIHWPISSRVFNLFLTLMAPLVLHFFARFPEGLNRHFYRPLLWLVYGGAGLSLLTIILGPLIADSALSDTRRLHYSFVGLTLVAALALLCRRRAAIGLQSQRHKLMIVGLVISLSPLLVLSLGAEIVYGSPVLDYAWSFPFLVLMPISYAYTLHQGQLGKIDLLLNRTLVYGLLIIALLSLYMLLFLGVGQLLPATSASHPLLSAALAVLVAAGYTPLRTHLQRWIDFFFYGGWYNYRTVVRTTSSKLSQVLNQECLVEQLLAIARLMRFQEAALLWHSDALLTPIGSFGYTPSVLKHFHLPVDGVLVQALDGALQPVWSDDLWHTLRSRRLTQNERALARIPQILLWLPLVSRGTLRAVLVLGHRQGDMLPDSEDLDILATVAVQAGLAADNVTLVERLRARLADMERMRDELATAHRRLGESHEEERRHLARQLHDGAVQQLLGITYQLVESRRRVFAQLPSDSREREDLAITLDMAREEVLSVTRELRGLISELRPAGLEEFGLTTALHGYIDRLQRQGGAAIPKIQIDLAKIGPDLPMPIALCLFRTAQEAVRNALKHAQAQAITLRLRQRPDEVALHVFDNGIGFDLPPSLHDLSQDDHFGLIGMAEQVAWVQGEMTIQSQLDVGTDIVIRIPLQREGKHT
jgi:signal transduction histidine kinase